MITDANREHAIEMLKNATKCLKKGNDESDDSALSYIKSALGEIADNLVIVEKSEMDKDKESGEVKPLVDKEYLQF